MKPGSILLLSLLFVIGCSNRPDVEWKVKMQAPVTHSPAVSENKLIIGSADHYLYALDLKNGELVWKSDLGDRMLMPPLVEGKNIYIGTGSGYFYQIDAEDGSPRWKFKADGMLEFNPCSDSDGIYFGSHGGNFYKISRQGQLLWAFQTGNQMTSSCTFYKDLVITSSWDTNIYGLRRDSGAPVWKFPTGEFNYGNGVVSGDQIIYGTHHMFYRLDAATGKVLFQEKTTYNTHMVAFQNFVYTQENGLTKRSLDGRVVKSLAFSPFEQFRPAVVQDKIVASDTTFHLYGISTDMKFVWKFRGKDLFWSSGVLHDGIYYIGNRDSYVYALKLPS